MRKKFNKFEDGVIKIANGELDTPIINKLVNDILILSELEIAKTDEKKQFKKFSLNSMIRNVADNFYHFKPKINFIADCEIEFVGNEELMATALSNLLTNAIKYSETEKIDIILSKTDKEISLQVRDYGIGIPQKHIPHLFEKFYRIDKSRSKRKGGTGLGLTIVKNIVELHDAVIEVDSSENRGTTFTVLLNNKTFE